VKSGLKDQLLIRYSVIIKCILKNGGGKTGQYVSKREVLYNILSYCGTSMRVGRLIQMHFSYYYR